VDFQFEKHGDPQEFAEEETNVAREEEADNNTEVAKHANERNTETGNHEFQIEGTKERLAKLPFRPAKLGYDITGTFQEVADKMEGTQEGMAERDKAAAVPPSLGITISEASAYRPLVTPTRGHACRSG
jgi:hypothetical protein